MVFNRIRAALFASAVLTGSAAAAPAYIPPPPMFSWTGFYAGVNIGYGFGNNDPDYGAHNFFFATPATPITQITGGGLFGPPHQI